MTASDLLKLAPNVEDILEVNRLELKELGLVAPVVDWCVCVWCNKRILPTLVVDWLDMSDVFIVKVTNKV
jgi:hypothetical protein